MAQAPAGQAPAAPDLARVLSTSLNKATAATSILTEFNGNPKEYRQWIKTIEKYVLMTEQGVEALKVVAFQTARGAVSDYIHRFIKDHPNATWQEMKTDLAVRFADIVDEAHARALLRTMRQKNGESLQIFAERLLSASEDAINRSYHQAGTQNLLPGIERQ